MSASVSATPAAVSPAVEPDPLAPPTHDRRKVRLWGWAVTLILLVAYLALQNPYWVPGGDSDFYVSIARTMVMEGKYQYNGLPVAISPPGWPWAMAQILKISPTFLALKLFTMSCMLASLVIGYFVALRFVKPSAAGISVLLAGLLMPVYSLTYFLHSEGLYCLLAAWALLICFRVREGRARLVEKPLLVLLCVAIPMVRWAGVFQLLPIVAVLMSGLGWKTAWQSGIKPFFRFIAIQRHGLLALLCVVALVVTWQTTRRSLELTTEQLKQLKEIGGNTTMDDDVEVPAETAGVPTLPQASSKNLSIWEDYGQRFFRAGKWFSWLLWQPSRFATAAGKLADNFVILVGWGVILMLGAVAIGAAVRKGEWLWISLGLYCGGLCMNWPNPNSRYFVPIAPLIILGLFVLFYEAGRRYPGTTIDWWKWIRRAFVYSVLLVNLLLYGTDVIVMRTSKDFYATFEAGQHKDLVNIAHYLMQLPPLVEGDPATQPTHRSGTAATVPTIDTLVLRRPTDGRIMINERYENLGRIRFSPAGMRAMVLLTGLNIKPMDRGYAKTTGPGDPATMGNNKAWPTRLLRYIRYSRARYVLMQSPAIPWRVWHFRLSMEWQDWLSKHPGQPPSGGWTLYAYDPETNDLYEVPVPDVDNWPTRVPGM